MSVDVMKCLSQLSQERYRVMIIHIDALHSDVLTRFGQKICDKTGGKYLDLLETFIEQDELHNNIDRFRPDNLKELLKEKAKGFPLMVVDRMDFLLDTWHRHEKQAFWGLVEDQWDGFLRGMKPSLIFCMQSSDEIERLSVLDSHGRSRVHQLSDFNDLW